MNATDIKEINSALEDFIARSDDRISDLTNQLQDVEAKINRKGLGGGAMPSNAANDTAGRFSAKVGDKIIPILNKDEKLSTFYKDAGSENNFTLADYCRGAMGFQNAVTSGPALIPTHVGAEIIDAVRAASAVVEAGAGTINIDGPTNFAKITGDPTVYQHDEGVEDITESAPTIVAVEADPKALVAAVPLPAEVVADSPNLNAVLNMSLAAAFASKLDTLSLATILADASIPTSSAGQDPAAWADVLSAVSEALAADQNLPSSLISSPGDFMARAAQVASTAGSWLGKPPVLDSMRELYTSSVSDGTSIFGDFLRGFAIAVRQELRVEVVRFAKHKSYSHVLVAHARMNGYVLQPNRLFIQKETVV